MSNLSNTVSFDQFNSMLLNIQKQSNIEGVANDLSKIGENAATISSTTIGKRPNENISGIECFTLEFDKSGESLVEGVATVRINSGVPGYESILKKTPSRKNDIEKITGSLSSDGFLMEIIGGSSPEAIFKNLSTNTGKEPGQEVIGNVTIPEYSDRIIGNIQRSITGLETELAKGELDNVQKSVQSVVNNFDGGFINNLLNTTNDVLKGEVNQITKGVLPANVIRDIMQKVLLGEKRKASQTAREYLLLQQSLGNDISGLNIGEVEEKIYNIDPSVSNILDTQSSSFENIKAPTTPIEQLNLNDYGISDDPVNRPPTGSTSVESKTLNTNTEDRRSKFTFVNSYEELITDFRGANREITEVVVHWTANFLNQGYVGSEEIEKIHIQKGWSTIGYHYIIKRDGSLQRGRPINREGSHALANGHNRYSIGIAFVGGYNCNSGNPNYLNFISAESITGEQWKTLDQFLKAFYVVWPGGQVWGHNDIDPGNKVDPGIDMVQYVRNKFNKFNVASSGILPPFSSSQLVG